MAKKTKRSEVTEIPRESLDQATVDALIAAVKLGHGFMVYEAKVTRKNRLGRPEEIHVEVREKFVKPKPQALEMLDRQGIKYTMKRAGKN